VGHRTPTAQHALARSDNTTHASFSQVLVPGIVVLCASYYNEESPPLPRFIFGRLDLDGLPDSFADKGAGPITTINARTRASAAMDHRPRSRQRVSMSWEEDDAAGAHHRMMQVQFAEECIETKTITTTTTTKRSYPPIYVREPRDPEQLDSKEYPLASRPTPPELRSLTFDLGEGDDSRWGADGADASIVSYPFVACLLKHANHLTPRSADRRVSSVLETKRIPTPRLPNLNVKCRHPSQTKACGGHEDPTGWLALPLRRPNQLKVYIDPRDKAAAVLQPETSFDGRSLGARAQKGQPGSRQDI
jgi:hypothetical protein